MRPIAVGCTLRRLAAKVASNKALEDTATLLAPHQLGYGVKGGAEAAVHSARLFLRNLKPDQALLKLDFKNAFNSVRRDKMLSSVLDLAPDISLLCILHIPYLLSFFGMTKVFNLQRVYSKETLLAPSFFASHSISSIHI